MVLINLLPWRMQEQRYIQKQRRFMLLAAILIAMAVLVMLHAGLIWWEDRLAHRLAELNAAVRQQQMRRQNRDSVGEMQNATLYQQMSLYQDATSGLISKLSAPNSEGVCFNKIIRNQGGVKFNGTANSAQALSAFLINWPAASYFTQIHISNLKPDTEGMLAFTVEGVEKNRVEMPAVKQGFHPHV